MFLVITKKLGALRGHTRLGKRQGQGEDFFLSPGPLHRTNNNTGKSRHSQYLDAVQGLRCGQDGDIWEGVLSLLRRKT